MADMVARLLLQTADYNIIEMELIFRMSLAPILQKKKSSRHDFLIPKKLF